MTPVCGSRHLPGDGRAGRAGVGPVVGQQALARRARRHAAEQERERRDAQRERAGRADRAQDARPLGHRRRDVDPARGLLQRGEHDDRHDPPGREREPDDEADRGVAEHEAGRGERVDGEGEHERREAEAEQHAVEPGRERDRQHAPPRLGHLAAHLRDDPPAGRVARGRRQQQRGRDRHGRALAGAERAAPSSARPPNVATPPASAPAANVAQASAVVRIRCA